MKKTLPALFILLSFFKAWAQIPTWSQDVAPILYANCTKCHHTGGIAPFSLMTYADAYNNAFSMSADVTNKKMPPWPPDENYKHYVAERVLSQTDIDKINNWVSGGRPQGDITLAPAQPTYTNASALGTVNLSVRIPTYTVSANNDVYRNFPIITTVTAGSYITGIEVIPGNTQIVHHVLVFQDSTNVPAQLDANQAGPGYNNAGGTGSVASKLISGYTPGASPYYTPVGTGFRLPANTNIVVQVHYPAGSQGLVDSTRINFKITSVPQREITVWPILNHLQNITPSLSIPAGQTKTFTEQASVGSGNYTFLSAAPHMHLIGKTIKSWAITTIPNDTIRFVDIPEWNFHWQDAYIFPNAVKVPANSTLKAIATYDNTSNNPDNPNSPPQNVTAGEATTDEMMMVFFAYMPYQSGDENLIISRRVIPQGATTFCNGQSVMLKTIEGTGYTYQWYRNGVSISGATSFSYAAAQAGNYHVLISLGPNNSLSDTIAVAVNSLPTAAVTPAGSTSLCPGTSVTLNASTGTGYSYQWLNNGTPVANATGASYSATGAGSYTVQVYNGCYANSGAVNVNAAAVPSNTVTPSGTTTFCQEGSVTLNAAVGLTYHWSNNAATQNITVTQNGTYMVTVTGANSCTAVSSETVVTVNALPDNTVTTNGSTTFCAGSSVNLSAAAGLIYHWSTGATGQTISATQSGNYLVTVTNGNNCSAVSIATDVTVNPLPVANITANGATSFCPGGSVTLTASNNSAYAWSNSSVSQSVTVSQGGTYTLTVTDADNCSSSASQQVIVLSTPDNSVLTDKPTTICPGDSVILSVPSQAAQSYLWSNNATTQSITVSTSGTYTVTITGFNTCTSISSPITVAVSNNAVAGITPSGVTTFCSGWSVQLTASAGTAYQWSTNETTASITVTASGSYTVSVTASGTCTAISNPVAVIVNTNPSVTLSGNMDTLCSGVAGITLSGENPIGGTFSGTGVTGNTFTPSTTGTQTITYSYTDNNGCSNTASENIEVVLCTGIEEATDEVLTITPNPSNGTFEIRLSEWNTGFAELAILDISGKQVFESLIEKQQTPVDLGRILSGYYLVQLKTNKGILHRKLMVSQ